MITRSLLTTFAIAILFVSACDDGTREQSPGEVLARDSSLASELKQADTSAFAEAADVAMAFDPDSAMPPVETSIPVREPIAQPSPIPEPAPSTAVASVPMRVERAATPARPSSTADGTTPARVAPPTPSRPSPSRPAPSRSVQMRPTPATIHADPLPGRGVSETPERRSASTRAAPEAMSERRAASNRATAASTNAATPAATNAAAILARVPGAALPPAGSDEPCASPAASSQRRCLMLHLARSDVALDRTYQSLIADMKRDAGTPAGAPEPPTVKQLRVSQRAWLVYRDTECRRRNRGKEGPLWAPVRAQCLGEFSGQRNEELAQALRNRR